jgi:hypothetical protein
MICAICKKPIEAKQLATIRQAWIDAGGWGTIPQEAIVHTRCDAAEKRRRASICDRPGDHSAYSTPPVGSGSAND